MARVHFDRARMKLEIIVFVPILLVLLVMSFIGNLFVLVVILKTKPLRRKPSVIYILNGAIANLMFVVIIGLSVMLIVLKSETTAIGAVNWYCRLYDAYFYLNAFILTYTIMIIALDKYFAIIKPFFYRQHSTPRSARIINLISWFVACIFSVPKFFLVFSVTGSRICRRKSTREPLELASELIHLVLVFLVPVIVTFVVYGRLVFRLWFSSQESHGTDIALLRSRRKLTKLSITVTVLFLICWLPHTVETAWWCLGFERSVIVELFKIYASLCVFAYSAISPAIYTFFNEATLRAARRMFCCKCFKTPRSSSRNIQVTPNENRSVHLLDMGPVKTDVPSREAFGEQQNE